MSVMPLLAPPRATTDNSLRASLSSRCRLDGRCLPRTDLSTSIGRFHAPPEGRLCRNSCRSMSSSGGGDGVDPSLFDGGRCWGPREVDRREPQARSSGWSVIRSAAKMTLCPVMRKSGSVPLPNAPNGVARHGPAAWRSRSPSSKRSTLPLGSSFQAVSDSLRFGPSRWKL